MRNIFLMSCSLLVSLTSMAMSGASTQTAAETSGVNVGTEAAAALPGLGGEISAHNRQWRGQALLHQKELNRFSSDSNDYKLTTHNSFNSGRYSLEPLNYADPNQKYTISEQLELGVRGINYDVHYAHGKLLLCHGPSDVLCHYRDRRLEDGLNELKTWLMRPENRNEQVHIYFQDVMDGRYDLFLNALSIIDDFVYKSEACGGTGYESGYSRDTGVALGGNVSMNVPGADCNSEHAYRQQLGRYSRLNAGPDAPAYRQSISQPGGSVVGAIWADQFPQQPLADRECIINGSFTAEHLQARRRNVSEDQTQIGRTFNPEKTLTDSDVRFLTDCGIEWQADQIHVGDSRIGQALFLWAESQPDNYGGSEHCGEMAAQGKINDRNCQVAQRFACKDNSGKALDWKITEASGLWSQGREVCRNEFGDSARFNVPKDGYQMRQLRKAKDASGVASVWVNYTDLHNEGSWHAADNPTIWWAALPMWSFSQPDNHANQEHCAEFASGSGLNDLNCNTERAIACRIGFDQWTIGQSSDWQSASCPGGSRFAMPEDEFDRDALHRAMQEKGESRVWVNYSDITEEGFWRANLRKLAELKRRPNYYNDYRQLKNDRGFCLDVEQGRDSRAGSRVHQWSCNEANTSQYFKLDDKNRLRWFLDPSLCVEAQGGSTNAGTAINLWYCHDGDNQKWLHHEANALYLKKKPDMVIGISQSSLGRDHNAKLEQQDSSVDQRWNWQTQRRAEIQDNNTICFYEDNNFTGNKLCYGPGHYSNIGEAMNDKISSIRIKGNLTALVYEHSGFSGGMLRVMDDTYNMGAFKDRITSITVRFRPDNAAYACLYEDPHFRGTSHCAYVGQQDSDLHNEHMNDKISSIKLFNGAVAGLYQDTGFSGTRRIVTSAQHALSGHLLADEISALKVKLKSQLCPYNNASFDGANCQVMRRVDGVSYWNLSGWHYYSPSNSEKQQRRCQHHHAVFDGANCRVHRNEAVNYWNLGAGKYYSPII